VRALCFESSTTHRAHRYDWEEFQAIPGCVRSRHSTETPGASLAASKGQEARAAMCAAADAEAAAAPPAPAAPALKSISAYNDANPDAATGAKSFGNSTGASAKPKVKRNADGSFRCQRKGCGKANARTDAGPVCIHHCGPPVFHETYKLWSCCPQARASKRQPRHARLVPSLSPLRDPSSRSPRRNCTRVAEGAFSLSFYFFAWFARGCSRLRSIFCPS
jgi:hypothetical protein